MLISKRFLSIFMLSFFFGCVSPSSLASVFLEKNKLNNDAPYIDKYTNMIKSFSSAISGESNSNFILMEAITESRDSGLIRSKDFILFGSLWDFAELNFINNNVSSASLVMNFSSDRAMKISFEDVSNRVYKRFGQLPDKVDKECLDSYDKVGRRCYRVFSIKNGGPVFQMSIYNNKMFLNVDVGGRDVKKKF